MIVKLNNGAVREIKKAEPMVEKRFEFNGNSYRMIAKANSNKEDITGVMFKFNNDRDDNMSVFAVNEENVFVGNLQYDEVQKILDSLLIKGYADMSVYDYQSKISAIVDTVFDEGMTKHIVFLAFWQQLIWICMDLAIISVCHQLSDWVRLYTVVIHHLKVTIQKI